MNLSILLQKCKLRICIDFTMWCGTAHWNRPFLFPYINICTSPGHRQHLSLHIFLRLLETNIRISWAMLSFTWAWSLVWIWNGFFLISQDSLISCLSGKREWWWIILGFSCHVGCRECHVNQCSEFSDMRFIPSKFCFVFLASIRLFFKHSQLVWTTKSCDWPRQCAREEWHGLFKNMLIPK